MLFRAKGARSMRRAFVVAACLALVLSFPELARADAFTFQNGVFTTYAGQLTFYGINDRGQIVGYSADSNTGFLLENNIFTPITGAGRFPIGINNNGQILVISGDFSNPVLVTNGVATALPS